MNEEPKTLVPKLRFFEFVDTEMWQLKQFGNLDLDVSDGNYSSKYPSQSDFTKIGVPFLRANNLKFGTVIDEDMRFISAKQHSEITKGHLKKGDILLTTRGELGTIALVPERHIGSNINAQLVRVNTANKLINTFLFQLLDYSRILGHFEALSTGTALKQLPIGKLNQLNLAIPVTLAEQQKIADCLSSLDDLITAQNQKVEALKQHKKGLMQQLFPAEGETVPKLRFPEFENDGEWQPRELSEIVTPVVREVSKPEANYLALGIRSHGKGTFHKPDQAPEKNAMDKLYLVNKGDLIVNITFAWEGAIAIVKEEDHGTYVSHRFPTYAFNEKLSSSSFFQYVIINKSFIYKLGLISPGGAGRNRVMNKSDFLKITVLLPSRDEQERVGKCLSSLDDAISTQIQKLEALKAHKKGLMQQLFPSLEELA